MLWDDIVCYDILNYIYIDIYYVSEPKLDVLTQMLEFGVIPGWITFDWTPYDVALEPLEVQTCDLVA